MRTLLTHLLAEQKKPTRVPYLRVEALDHFGGIPRLHWDVLYSGAEADGPHAVAIPTDGSLNRLRVASNVLYRQRVTTPGVGSDFTAWTSFRTTSVRCAIAAYGANLLAFAVDSGTPTQIYWCASADGGASWGAWALLCTAAGTVAHIAAASKPNGDTLVVFAVGATVYKIKRVSSVWGSITAWTNTVASVTGIAVQYWLDFNLVITGTDAATLNPNVWLCIYGDGYSETLNAWSVPRSITEATAGTNVAYSAPFNLYADTFRASYRNAFTGTVAYDRLDLIAMPIAADYVDNIWTEPRPFDLDHDWGLALASNMTSHFWATTPSRVYRAAYPTTLDLSADVLSCVAHDYPFDPRGATIRLRNDDGRYNSPGSGALIALSRGARINIGPGYYVPTYGGNYASLGPSYYIDAINHTAAAGRRELVIHCLSTWGLLAAWRPGRSYRWVAGTRNYFQIISQILAKMGLEYSSWSGTPKITDDYPDFAIHPGYDPPPYISGWMRWYHPDYGYIIKPIWTDPPPQPAFQQLATPSALSALATLYSHLEDRITTREDCLYNRWPQAADASVYAFGTTHAILSATYRQLTTPDRFLAIGDAGVTKETVDYTAVDLIHDRPNVVHDIGMTTAADVTARATREAREATISSRHDTIVVPPHCGIELWDVVDVTDPTLGLAAAKRRVTGITLVFDRSKDPPVYHQVLTLGAP